MAELTAVEFFYNEVSKLNVSTEARLFIEKIKNNANEMFEKQIIDASNESYLNSNLIKRSSQNKKVNSVGEQYYNDKFKK